MNYYPLFRVRSWNNGVRCMSFYILSDSHQIPSQKKAKLIFFKLPKIQILKFLQETLHATHLLKLLNKMYKYEMDPLRTVGATERTRDAGRTDGRSETNIPPTTLLCRGYKKNTYLTIHCTQCHCCWCPGSLCHVAFSSNDTDLFILEYSNFICRRVN